VNLKFVFAPLIFAAAGCGERTEKQPRGESFFPALSFIRSQVAHVDTALYSIVQVVQRDSLPADTQYLHREQFRVAAKDFLDLPDIAQKKLRRKYVEEKLYDETLNRVVLRYVPADPEKAELQKQEVLIAPDPSGDKVTSIFIEQVRTSRDSSVHKKLLWQVDRSFTVTTILQRRAQPETTTIVKVIWNEESEE